MARSLMMIVLLSFLIMLSQLSDGEMMTGKSTGSSVIVGVLTGEKEGSSEF